MASNNLRVDRKTIFRWITFGVPVLLLLLFLLSLLAVIAQLSQQGLWNPMSSLILLGQLSIFILFAILCVGLINIQHQSRKTIRQKASEPTVTHFINEAEKRLQQRQLWLIVGTVSFIIIVMLMGLVALPDLGMFTRQVKTALVVALCCLSLYDALILMVAILLRKGIVINISSIKKLVENPSVEQIYSRPQQESVEE